MIKISYLLYNVVSKLLQREAFYILHARNGYLFFNLEITQYVHLGRPPHEYVYVHLRASIIYIL